MATNQTVTHAVSCTPRLESFFTYSLGKCTYRLPCIWYSIKRIFIFVLIFVSSSLSLLQMLSNSNRHPSRRFHIKIKSTTKYLYKKKIAIKDFLIIYKRKSDTSSSVERIIRKRWQKQNLILFSHISILNSLLFRICR